MGHTTELPRAASRGGRFSHRQNRVKTLWPMCLIVYNATLSLLKVPDLPLMEQTTIRRLTAAAVVNLPTSCAFPASFLLQRNPSNVGVCVVVRLASFGREKCCCVLVALTPSFVHSHEPRLANTVHKILPMHLLVMDGSLLPNKGHLSFLPPPRPSVRFIVPLHARGHEHDAARLLLAGPSQTFSICSCLTHPQHAHTHTHNPQPA
jgi:hypothetical protein